MSKKQEVALKVEGLHKSFRLPHDNQSSIKGRLVNFRKRGYETQKVLKGISFEVHKGDFLGVVGRNGSGKSTLLKLLAGIYSPNKGTITINGKLTPFIELGVGFNPELSGRDNVFLNGALLGFSRAEMEKKYDEIVRFAELGRFMDQKLKNYSSGMQVRLAFSIAIQANTDILVLDEVLAVGDEAFQRKCFNYFKKLKQDKKTVILVTHDMGSVRKFCNRAIMIDKGEIVCSGTPEKVTNYYTLENVEESQAGDHKKTAEGHAWIKTELISKQVLEDNEKLRMKVSYYVPEDAPVSFGISLIDEASNHSVSVIDDGPYQGKKGKDRITSDKKGEHSFTYTLDLSLFNSRNFEITASLFRFDNETEEYTPYAFSDEAGISHFMLRRKKFDNGLLKLKGDWT